MHQLKKIYFCIYLMKCYINVQGFPTSTASNSKCFETERSHRRTVNRYRPPRSRNRSFNLSMQFPRLVTSGRVVLRVRLVIYLFFSALRNSPVLFREEKNKKKKLRPPINYARRFRGNAKRRLFTRRAVKKI